MALKQPQGDQTEGSREVVTPDQIEEPEPVADIPIPSIPQEKADEVPIEEMDPVERRTRIIIDVVNAGGALETVIPKYREYIDEELLEVLFKRIQTTAQFEEKSAVEGLVAVWRRLRSELERKNATPAMKLLDKLLKIVNVPPEFEESTEHERLEEATDTMMDAFIGPQAQAVDIFAIAKDLAEGGEPPEELMEGPVSRKAFVAEVEELLEDAKKSTVDAQKRLQSIKKQLRENLEQARQETALRRELEALRMKIDSREAVMDHVRNLLRVAKSLSHIPT
ncbi:hypothetical protein BSKO_04470 [Bryopsis sp. KO-2023]|nr:hypothetical protein BSKO_04470 [Bryopsis sp. KO-2023]